MTTENILLAQSIVSKRLACHYYKGEVSDSIFLTAIDGASHCRLYWFNDNDNIIYLDYLSVSEAFRKKGLGLKLQLLREQMGKILGAKTSILWVERGTWQRGWYERRGYLFHSDYKKEDAIWMKKDL